MATQVDLTDGVGGSVWLAESVEHSRTAVKLSWPPPSGPDADADGGSGAGASPARTGRGEAEAADW